VLVVLDGVAPVAGHRIGMPQVTRA
jgi:hypothetical protein